VLLIPLAVTITARSIVPRLKWRPGLIYLTTTRQALPLSHVVGAHDLFHFTPLHLSIAGDAMTNFVVAFAAIIRGHTRPMLSNPSQATVIGGHRCMVAPAGTLVRRWWRAAPLRDLYSMCALAGFT
jgi:hypothetical protein